MHAANDFESNLPASAKKLSNVLGSDIAAAEKDFNAYLHNELSTEKIADIGSYLLGSGNTEWALKDDFKNAKLQLRELEKCSGNPAQYKRKFKEVFGIDYDAKAIAAYMATPANQRTDAMREDAFGTGHTANILGRVDNYVASQIRGGKFVKKGIEAGVFVASGGNIMAVTKVDTAFELEEIAAGRTHENEYGRANLLRGEVSEWWKDTSRADLCRAGFDVASFGAGKVVTQGVGMVARQAGKVARPVANVVRNSRYVTNVTQSGVVQSTVNGVKNLSQSGVVQNTMNGAKKLSQSTAGQVTGATIKDTATDYAQDATIAYFEGSGIPGTENLPQKFGEHAVTETIEVGTKKLFKNLL